ncbi:MAG: ATP-dependent helicase [Propionibacteriales bacterium]|nr:ATP-dependent helicase [Propionibacteriales bacterium]
MRSYPDAVFVPGDPPRTGVLALWGDGVEPDAELDLVLPAGSQVRRTRTRVRLVPMADAIPLLTAATHDQATRSFRAWSTAALTGAGLIGRGRLLPAVSPGGYGAWRVGPLDRADEEWLDRLAAAMPARAHALPIEGTRPIRLRSPQSLVQKFWDAMADVLVRTSTAELAADAKPFTVTEPVDLEGPTEWLTRAQYAESAGVRLVLRIEPPEDEPDQEADHTETSDEAQFRGVLQLRSTADPSLLVDVADLWDAPAAVLSRLGHQAETDLLLTLRRGARSWPPLTPALAAASPTSVALGYDDLEDLLTGGAEALDGAGIEVLWPKGLFQGSLRIRAGVHATPAPPGEAKTGFSLDELLEFRWRPTLDGDPLTDDEVAALAEAKRPLIRLRGRWVKVDRELIDRLRRRTTHRLGPAEALAAALTGEVDVDGEPVEFRAEGSIADLAERITSAAAHPPDIASPAGLRATLRPYQQRGLAWLSQLTSLGLGGCLADDMGLGKTVQVIALHLHRRTSSSGPTLVICPTSLLGTWQRELEHFAPEVPVRRFHGGRRHLDDVADDEMVLTSYGVVRQDHETLAGIGWGLAVADEAQHAKNPFSRTAKSLRAVPATARVALTGTPVENRLSDLWSILDWTTPGILGPLDRFRHRLAVPVERYRDPEATARLGQITRPFLLRRRKSDPGIAPELPPKTESNVVVPLTTEQTTLYQAVVDESLAKIRDTEGIERRGMVLGLLTALKQVCNHPAQYLHESQPLPGRSGKLAALDELVDVLVDEGESVLVFSQYVEMCRLLEAHLRDRGFSSLFLHGGVGPKRREHLVDSFQSGEAPIFLLSLKAGGVGLNLTRATHVVHYDRWWNPAVEDQATDRAYRIGQDRPVQVHRLVTEGTLEDRIAAVIESKRDLADAVVGSGEAWIGELSDAELSDLVRLGGTS